MNVCVFIEYIIEVGDLPAELRLVGVREDLQEIEPADLRLEADDVLDLLLIVRTEEDGRVVLVFHEKFHWRFNQHGGSHHVGLVIVVEVVEEVPLVILRHVDSLRRAQDRVLAHAVLRLWQVLPSLEVDAVGDLHLEQLQLGLIYSQIGHFNVEPVEVDASDALLHVAGKLALANLIEPEVVGECAGLVKFAEQPVDLVVGVVKHELVPEAALGHPHGLVLVSGDNLLEVPGEGEHIGVLLL